MEEKTKRNLIIGSIILFAIMLSLDTVISIFGVNMGLYEANPFALGLMGSLGDSNGLIAKSGITFLSALCIVGFSSRFLSKYSFIISLLFLSIFIVDLTLANIQNILLIT